MNVSNIQLMKVKADGTCTGCYYRNLDTCPRDHQEKLVCETPRGSSFIFVPKGEDFFDHLANKIINETTKEEPMTALPDNNPKTAVAATKPKLSDVPTVALFALGAAMSDGASKYGRYNYRDTNVTASVFYDAMMRHLTAWYNGEDHAPDSKVHHLGHIMASCAIALDAELHAKFNDDRDARLPCGIDKGMYMDITL